MKKRIAFLTALVFLLGTLNVFVPVASAETTVPDLDIAACNLSFRDAIAIKYAVPETAEDVKILIWTTPQTEYTLATSDDVITTYNTVDYPGYFVFDYTGVAAKEMTDVVYARAYAEIDGEDCYGKLTRYSVLQYVYNKLGYTAAEAATDSDQLSALLAAMLDYGAMAQVYFDYNIDRLANAYDEWHDVRVANGATLDTYFTHGIYHEGDTATLTAPQTDANGFKFAYWENSAGDKIATTATYELTVTAGDIYTPVYVEEIELPEWPEWPAKSTKGLEYDFDEEYGAAFVLGIGTCTDTVIVIASEYEGYPVTDIDPSAFAGEAITAVYIPDTVTTIGNGAFQNCSELTDVYYKGTSAEWDENVSVGRNNTPITSATMHFVPYLVTFVDYDGTVLKSEYVDAGESATAPAAPTRENYIFAGWDVSFDAVESNLTVKAQYKYNTADPCIFIDEAAADAGDTVEIKLSILNNPGIAALNLTLSYDTDVLTLDMSENGTVFPTLDVARNLFFSADDTCEGDGVLATLTFTVNSDAADGIYPISLTVNEAVGSGLTDIADEFTAVAGSVIVGDPTIDPPATTTAATTAVTTTATTPPVTEPVEPATLTVNNVTAEEGEATLTVEIKDNPGIAAANMTLDYDTNALTLAEVTNGSIFPTLDAAVNLLFSADSNCTENGILATLKFTVNEGAEAGTYPVTLVVNEAYNDKLKPVTCTVVAGSITVEEPPVPAEISIDSVTAEDGEATLTLEIKDNPGLALISLTLDYDTEALTLDEVLNGSIFPTLDVGLNLLFSADANCEGDGILASLKFKVKPGAQVGTYPITFVVNEVINEDLRDMTFESIAGSINVEIPVTEPPVTEPPVTEPPVTTVIPEEPVVPELPEWPAASDGIVYDIDEEAGIAYVAGIGTCTDKVIVIASEYEGYPVTDIDGSAFEGEAITAVYLPNTVTAIGKAAFQNCSELTDVYYNGAPAEWDEVTVGRNNSPFTSATMHFNPFLVTFVDYDGTVLKYEYVDAGESATAPADPARENYVFAGWDVDFSAVESALTVVAQYKYDTEAPCIVINDAVAVDGVATLTVSIQNNPGIAALNLTLNGTASEWFDTAENGAILPTLDIGTNLFWSADGDSAEDGVLATLIFNVEGLEAGTYPVTFKLNEAVSNFEEVGAQFTTVNGSIIVK